MSKVKFSKMAMTNAQRCQSAYSEVIVAKYGRDVAGVLAALIDHRDFLCEVEQLPTSDWFFIEWIRLERKTGMSRTPINRAVDTLVDENLIQLRPGSYRRPRYYKINIGNVIKAMKIDKNHWRAYTSPETKKAKLEKCQSNTVEHGWFCAGDIPKNLGCSHKTTDVFTVQQMLSQNISDIPTEQQMLSQSISDVPTEQINNTIQNQNETKPTRHNENQTHLSSKDDDFALANARNVVPFRHPGMNPPPRTDEKEFEGEKTPRNSSEAVESEIHPAAEGNTPTQDNEVDANPAAVDGGDSVLETLPLNEHMFKSDYKLVNDDYDLMGEIKKTMDAMPDEAAATA